MCDGGVAAAREKRFGALSVVEEAQGDHAAQGVVHLCACLDGHVAAGGFAQVGLQVAFDGALVADAEVEAHGQAMCKVVLAATAAIIIVSNTTATNSETQC